MAGIFHKGVRYGGFGNLWGMIKGSLSDQADLQTALDSKTEKDRYIVRQVTASAGQQVRIPASGTDARIKTTGCEVKAVAQKKSDGTSYKFKSIEVYDGYAQITLGEEVSNVYLGVKVTKNGYNVDDLVPMKYDISNDGLNSLNLLEYSSLNIDRINNSNGYIHRLINNSSFQGTFPSGLGGNAILLMGFSAVGGSNNKIQYGVQIAIGFGSSKIAVRNVNYNDQGSEWGAWSYLTP